MTYVVFWLFFSIIAGVIATRKGRSGIGSFKSQYDGPYENTFVETINNSNISIFFHF